MVGFYMYSFLMWLFLVWMGVIEIFGVWVKILEFPGILFINWKVTIKQTVSEVSIIHFL